MSSLSTFFKRLWGGEKRFDKTFFLVTMLIPFIAWICLLFISITLEIHLCAFVFTYIYPFAYIPLSWVPILRSRKKAQLPIYVGTAIAKGMLPGRSPLSILYIFAYLVYSLAFILIIFIMLSKL